MLRKKVTTELAHAKMLNFIKAKYTVRTAKLSFSIFYLGYLYKNHSLFIA